MMAWRESFKKPRAATAALRANEVTRKQNKKKAQSSSELQRGSDPVPAERSSSFRGSLLPCIARAGSSPHPGNTYLATCGTYATRRPAMPWHQQQHRPRRAVTSCPTGPDGLA
jgi:hypothetical protein